MHKICLSSFYNCLLIHPFSILNEMCLCDKLYVFVCVGKPSLNVVWGSRAAVCQPARGRLSSAAVLCQAFLYYPPPGSTAAAAAVFALPSPGNTQLCPNITFNNLPSPEN